jgi:hypothetical protein
VKKSRVLAIALLSAMLLVAGTGVVWADGRVWRGNAYDVDEVSAPLFEWALGFDEEDEAMMRDAFTPDADFYFYLSTSDDPIVFEGREAVMDLFLGAIADQTPDEQRRHVTTNVVVDPIDRHTATVTSYLSLMVSLDPTQPPELRATGVYTDTVVLGRDGEWRIKERILRLDTPS